MWGVGREFVSGGAGEGFCGRQQKHEHCCSSMPTVSEPRGY